MSTARDDSPADPELTFGVEMEAFAAMEPQHFQALEAKSLRSEIKTRLDALPWIETHMLKQDFMSTAQYALEPDYSVWNITEDPSVEPNDCSQFAMHEVCQLELISPIYKANSPDWEQDFRGVLHEETFNPLDQPMIHFETNMFTHLHVHIGQGTNGFDFRTVRNLALLVLLFEDELDSIHETRMGFEYTGSSYSMTNLCGRKLQEVCQTIWHECVAIEDVVEVMCPSSVDYGLWSIEQDPRHYKFNFNALLTPKKTVEARQHEGTLSAPEIIFWVKCLDALVTAAATVTDELMFAVMNHGVYPPDAGRCEVLRLMLRTKRLPTLEEALAYARGTVLRPVKNDLDFYAYEGPYVEADFEHVREWFQRKDTTIWYRDSPERA